MTGAALPRRPIAVVLLQAAIVIAILSFVPSVVAKVAPDVPQLWRADALGLSLRVLPWLGVVAFLLFALWALWYRRPYGRWLGLPLIAVMFAGLVYGYFSGPQVYADGKYDPQDGFPWGRLTALALLAWWFYAFGFTRKAKAFFAVEQKQEQA